MDQLPSKGEPVGRTDAPYVSHFISMQAAVLEHGHVNRPLSKQQAELALDIRRRHGVSQKHAILEALGDTSTAQDRARVERAVHRMQRARRQKAR